MTVIPGWGRLVTAAGGKQQLKLIALLGAALALAAGDQTIVGAVAPELKIALGISNTQVGLLITAASLLGGLSTLPFGMLADRIRRVRLLALCVFSWTISIGIAGAAQSYLMLLFAQLALGAGIGAATPIVASLTGDLFPAASRGRVFGLILSGEFLGASAVLLLAGEMAAWWSWRGSFWVACLPGAVLAIVLVRHLPEPARGAMDLTSHGVSPAGLGDASSTSPEHERATVTLHHLVVDAGVEPHPGRVLTEDPTTKSLSWAVRYVLSIPSNVWLVIASSLAYYYVAGLQAFIVVFLRGRFDFGQGTATVLLVMVGVATVIGILITGPLSDRLIARGYIASRPLVAGVSLLFAVAFALPGMLIPMFAVAWPILLIGAAGIGGANPAMDAARLDVMHSRLWGRAESVRTLVQTVFKSSAPLVFGYLSVILNPAGAADQVQGGGAVGLTRTLTVMLAALLIAGLFLVIGARRNYARDVATAMASERATATS